MRVMSVVLLSVALLSAAPVAAQSLNKPDAAQAFMQAENPHLKKLNQRTQELSETLGEAELKNLFHIREAFGAVRAVGVVRKDVGNAVKSCGKANPDLKMAMDQRFDAWGKAVDPAMRDVEEKMNAAIDAQSYMKPKDVRAYLKLIQQTAEYADGSIDKIYATAKADCEALLASMDGTQDVVGRLLGDLKIPAYDPADTELDVPADGAGD